MNRKIKKILIANRGEIAVRIVRTCCQLGIKTAVVYSDVDSNAVHLRDADQRYPLGAPKSSESYLNQDKILDIAKRADVDAIHPGYGFLSENAAFAQRVREENIIFIGPSPESMRLMGEKISARKLARSLGIPTVPGSIEPIATVTEGMDLAAEIGYPVMLKASGGGGGKGMRLVNSPQEFSENFQRAKSEAASAFGDDHVYIEKYLFNPRHVEVQILADRHGNAIHLGERECSIQRRHQKILEESPSIYLTPAHKRHLYDAALQLVMASKYINAGTIEFIIDQDKNFYFLEMNTRLQVEHPVTELRTGIDIVREQIYIAAGRRLTVKQKSISFRGHAIECRIYAEDPLNGFLPSIGTIVHLQSPSGAGIREDSGIEIGSTVSPFYDPLLAKLIVWGSNRAEAIVRMKRALKQYELFGVRNNISLCRWVVDQMKFQKGECTTTFLDTNFQAKFLMKSPDKLIDIAMITALHKRSSEPIGEINPNPIKVAGGWISKRRVDTW